MTHLLLVDPNNHFAERLEDAIRSLSEDLYSLSIDFCEGGKLSESKPTPDVLLVTARALQTFPDLAHATCPSILLRMSDFRDPVELIFAVRWTVGRTISGKQLVDMLSEATIAWPYILQYRKANEEGITDRNRRFQDMSRRLLTVQENERRQMARELHDESGGLITSIMLRLSMVSGLDDEQNEEIKPVIDLIEKLGAQVRSMSLRLRPDILDDFGLMPAIRSYAERYTGKNLMDVEIEDNLPEDIRFEFPVETSAYRIIQEALTNVSRHAETDRARITVHLADVALRIQIQDWGRGFHPGNVRSDLEHMGLLGMIERTQLLDGTIDITSTPNEGTLIAVSIPVNPAGEGE